MSSGVPSPSWCAIVQYNKVSFQIIKFYPFLPNFSGHLTYLVSAEAVIR